MHVKNSWNILLAGLCFVVIAMVVGCVASTPQTGTIYQRLQNEDPAVRIEAIIQAGDRKDTKAVPLLVDRLSDTQPDVRLFAIMALRKITGMDFGWRAYDPADKRNLAIRRWQQWIKEQHENSESTSEPTLTPTTTQPA